MSGDDVLSKYTLHIHTSTYFTNPVTR